MAEYCRLGVLDADVWRVTGVVLSRTAQEVPVLAAAPGDSHQDEPGLHTALVVAAAPDGALEVVDMLTLTFAGLREPPVEHRLNPSK